MRLTFCGVRGSTPAPGPDFVRYGGHTSCVAVAHDGAAPTLILDAGTGVRRVTAQLNDQPFTGAILLTHLHWDHTQGLPFFRAGDRDDARVTLLLPDQQDGTGAEEVLARVMSPPHFPIRPGQLRGSWSFGAVSPGELEAGGFTVQAREIPHKGGRTLGYRVSDGRSVAAYVTDHCPTALGPGPDGWGEYHAAALELAAGADIVAGGGGGGRGGVRACRGRLRGRLGRTRWGPAGGAVPPPAGPDGRRSGPAGPAVRRGTGPRHRGHGGAGTPPVRRRSSRTSARSRRG